MYAAAETCATLGSDRIGLDDNGEGKYWSEGDDHGASRMFFFLLLRFPPFSG